MGEKTLVFVVENETKNTVRFKEKPEPGMPPIIGALYVQKWAFHGDIPQELTVTIKG